MPPTYNVGGAVTFFSVHHFTMDRSLVGGAEKVLHTSYVHIHFTSHTVIAVVHLWCPHTHGYGISRCPAIQWLAKAQVPAQSDGIHVLLRAGKDIRS